MEGTPGLGRSESSFGPEDDAQSSTNNACEEVSRTGSPFAPLVNFEVKPRDYFIYYVTAENPGDLIKWSFYTKKKSVAFGLFYLHSKSPGHGGGEEGMPAGGSRMSRDELKALIEESRGMATIYPPPKNAGSAGLSRSNSQVSRNMASSDGSLPVAAPTTGGNGLLTTASFNISNSSVGSAPLATAASMANSQADFFHATAAFGQQQQQEATESPFEFFEILPIERYESYECTINGSFKVPLAGVYALCFDNSFSINTSKHVFLGLRVIPAALLAGHGILGSEQLPFVGGALGAQNETIVMEGWMMKKKRRRIQGWARRWVQLESNGTLSYFSSRSGSCRGSLNVKQSSVARVPQRRLITLDSDKMTFHLRALDEEDYVAWAAALSTFHGDANAARTLDSTPSIPVEDLVKLRKYEGEIGQRIGELTRSIAELRTLAASTDDGSLERYVGPLEATFQSLDSLFGQVCGWAGQLGAVQQALLNPRIQATATPASDAVEEIFYDLELTDLSSDEDDLSEYADAELFEPSASLDTLATHQLVNRGGEFQFRSTLPAPAPECNVSLASILRKSIGKDSSGMVMPMGLNEPVGALQRLCEELEYSELLDRAANENDPVERLVHVAAFAVSGYASGRARADRKPFNPMLGETFEWVDAPRGLQFVAEKVSHRPLVLACHAQTPAWQWWQEQRAKTKFWGKSVEYIPAGSVNVRFADGQHLRWSKVVSCLRNVLGSKKWIEHYGEMTIEDVRNPGVRATISFKSSGSTFFGSGSPGSNELSGTITNGTRTVRISGRWDDILVREDDGGRMEVVWRAAPLPPLHQEYYGLSYFALRLNQLLPGQSEGLPPSDTRLRPDQRLLEEARVEQAEAEQMRLIERQRQVRAEMEAAGQEWQPRWFRLQGEQWIFSGDYWEARERREWSDVPSLW